MAIIIKLMAIKIIFKVITNLTLGDLNNVSGDDNKIAGTSNLVQGSNNVVMNKNDANAKLMAKNIQD